MRACGMRMRMTASQNSHQRVEIARDILLTDSVISRTRRMRRLPRQHSSQQRRSRERHRKRNVEPTRPNGRFRRQR